MRKRTLMITILLISLLLIVLAGISNYSGTLEQAMNEAGISERKIYHTVEVEEGTLVFYVPMDHPWTLHVGLINKNVMGYEWVSGTDIGSFDGGGPMTYGFSNIGESDIQGDPKALPIHSGVIYEEAIDSVTLEFGEGRDEMAEIIETETGRFWYFLPDGEAHHIPAITGYGSNGEPLYQN